MTELLHKLEQNIEYKFACFISHAKKDADAEAAHLATFMKEKLYQECFFDVEQLAKGGSLGKISDCVRNSAVLLLLQTKHVLQRPWVLIELHAALKYNVPIVCVHLNFEDKEKRYVFEEVSGFLSHLETELNADDIKTMLGEGIPNVAAFGNELARVLPKIISSKIDYTFPEEVRKVMREMLVTSIRQKQDERRQADLKAWSAEQREV